LDRSRESGTGAGGALVTQAAERKRRFERRVRLVAGPWSAPWVTMKRSITDGVSTSAGCNSRPTEVAKDPSLPAAKSRALARTGLLGCAAITTALAKAATSGDNERGA